VTQVIYGDDQPVWTVAPVLIAPRSSDKKVDSNEKSSSQRLLAVLVVVVSVSIY